METLKSFRAISDQNNDGKQLLCFSEETLKNSMNKVKLNKPILQISNPKKTKNSRELRIQKIFLL